MKKHVSLVGRLLLFALFALIPLAASSSASNVSTGNNRASLLEIAVASVALPCAGWTIFQLAHIVTHPSDAGRARTIQDLNSQLQTRVSVEARKQIDDECGDGPYEVTHPLDNRPCVIDLMRNKKSS